MCPYKKEAGEASVDKRRGEHTREWNQLGTEWRLGLKLLQCEAGERDQLQRLLGKGKEKALLVVHRPDAAGQLRGKRRQGRCPSLDPEFRPILTNTR